MRFLLLCGVAGVAGLLPASCATSPETEATGGGPGAGGSPVSASSGTGGGLLDAGQGGAGGGGTPVLYVHSNTTLFVGDPSVTPLALSQVGDFDCLGGAGQDPAMTDIAVNEAGEIWGISESNVYRLEIDGAKVHCAETIPLDNPTNINFYGLAFAPKGVLAADAEVLVAANSAGELWSVDGAGNLAQRGTFGTVPANDGNGHSYANAGKSWELSGDVVIFANQGNPVGFATVRDCPNPPSPTGCNTIDTLVDLDIAAMAQTTTGSVVKSVRGQVVKSASCGDSAPGYGSVYGVAAYGGKVYGFSRVPNGGGGFAIDIDNKDGTACLITAFPASAWAGAGISTLAPIEEPPPK